MPPPPPNIIAPAIGSFVSGPDHSATGAASSPVAEIFLAVVDLFRSSLLAGFGLLDASWRGLGLALGRLFDGSLLNLVAFGVFVIGVDALFLRLLLKARRKVRQAASDRETDGHASS